jgi:hypothetical protein
MQPLNTSPAAVLLDASAIEQVRPRKNFAQKNPRGA